MGRHPSRRIPTLTVAAPPVSIAEMQTSPSPWAKCRSPIESIAPGTCTGSSRRLPGHQVAHVHVAAVLARRERAQAVGGRGRGGELGVGQGHLCAGIGQGPLAPQGALEQLGDGATPITPANTPARTATPGTCSERATPSSIRHCARNGSGKRSPRNPEPGQIPVQP